MDTDTFWDKRVTSIVLGLITTAISLHAIVKTVIDMSAVSPNSAADPLIFLGSIGPFMIGLMVTVVVMFPGKLVNMTWTTINNMFGGLLGGYGLYLFGLSSIWASSVTNTQAGAVIAGIGASLAVASLIKWP